MTRDDYSSFALWNVNECEYSIISVNINIFSFTFTSTVGLLWSLLIRHLLIAVTLTHPSVLMGPEAQDTKNKA